MFDKENLIYLKKEGNSEKQSFNWIKKICIDNKGGNYYENKN